MKADLHLHSKYSDRPTEWFLRRIGAPECFSEPEDLYRHCRSHGMDFVTITDHNRIDGALSIAHLPGTFVSAELTTYFPEDGCKVHCLVYDIDEAQFRDLQPLRPSIYDLQQYLGQHGIVHAIAHPLFRVNDILTIEHVEKLLVMFNRFELLNGSRHARAGELAAAVFGQLTPDLIEQMACRHGLPTVGATPWIKCFTGGSDDHSGVFAASAFTVTPDAGTTAAFLEHLRAGRHEAGGTPGSSLRLAHSLYQIAYSYYRSRFLRSGSGTSVLGEVLKRVIEGSEREPAATPSRLRSWVERVVRRRRLRKLSQTERTLVEEFTRLRERGQAAGTARRPAVGREDQSFETACRLSQELSYAFVRQLMTHAGEGRLVDGLQSLASLGTVVLGIAPYLTAFGVQHKDERFLQAVAARFPAGAGLQRRSRRRVWVTDTFQDVNGVAHTIRSIGSRSRALGRPITVLTCLDQAPEAPELDLVNFKPLGFFALPEYETQQLAFPPFLEVLEHIERSNAYEVIISTPGPLGLAGLLAARLLGLRTSGIYHTDFPQYVRCLTKDEMLEQATWRYMQWFYGGMDTIYVPSECYRRQLTDNGFDPAKLRVLPRGVDMDRFTPAKRDPAFWGRFGLNGNLKLLYVGRISREKNLQTLIDAFRFVRTSTPNVDLVIVGDGPDREALEAQTVDGNIAFTGFLHGDDLARAYASADLFVFPSATDTFGNVVLEAHASGLPAIVSTQGGPAEIVSRNQSGLAVDVRTPAPMCAAIRELVWDAPRRREMGERALQTAQQQRWEQVVEQF